MAESSAAQINVGGHHAVRDGGAEPAERRADPRHGRGGGGRLRRRRVVENVGRQPVEREMAGQPCDGTRGGCQGGGLSTAQPHGSNVVVLVGGWRFNRGFALVLGPIDKNLARLAVGQKVDRRIDNVGGAGKGQAATN